ncbi:MAG: TolB family protein, partial [Gemmatimonadaceae bacterium]
MLLSLFALLLQAAPVDSTFGVGAHNPAYAPDGRLAVSVRGDLWVESTSGQWTQITSGPAWDREPSWSADGSSIVFSSDRSGNFDLWRVSASGGGEPEQLTTSPLPDEEPSVAPDGRIVFVRGRLGAAEIWVRLPNGAETRLTKDRAAEHWPAVSPDGSRVAYVAIADGTHKLHARNLDTDRDTVVLTDARIERPAWSPNGDRLSWTASGARGAVFVTPLDGRYANVLSTRHAESAWSPDGKTIALADITPDAVAPVSYNGDPDRTGDREANLLSPSA